MRIVTALSLTSSILIFPLSPISLAEQNYGSDTGYRQDTSYRQSTGYKRDTGYRQSTGYKRDTGYRPDNYDVSDSQKHIIQPGESLSQIAQMYGHPIALLSHYNRISHPDDVRVGQIIYMPNNAYLDELLLPENAPAANTNMVAASSMANDVNQAKTVDTQNIGHPYQAAPSDSQISPNPHKTFSTTKPYSYFGNGESITNVLRNFASNYDIPIVLSASVKGVVNGRFGPLTPVDFLEKMAYINNMIWYFDGNTLYIYSSQEIEKNIISLLHISTEKFRQTLVDIGIWDNRFYWRSQSSEGIIYLSGPPRYMELVTQTAQLLDAKANSRQKNKVIVKVFKLKYASADDRSFQFRNQQVVIPGIASILQNIVQGSGGISMNSDISQQSTQGVQKATPVGQTPQQLSNQSASNVKADHVYISADRRLNAVIINDLATKMPMYESLINTLDKPLAQVEINVSIIDINTDSLDRLGVNWKLEAGGRANNFIEFNPFGSNANINDTFSTIIKNTTGGLYAQVNLLSSEGKAKVLARPSVLTLDNMEAILDNSQTFYVEVASSDDAQLFPVTYGSVLKVTPRIVEEITGRRIHMSVNIQDGARGDSKQNVKELPTIKNSSISTQAVIDENESLLIGGYYYESKNQNIHKVPLVGDIPLLGAMFRSKSDTYIKTVRLFLITPRIINMM
ncbi:MAG: type III secretion system outer membrane ring subunit SctC [Endozoicomonadaceae bacterium]|nr:type III secretion system outer membrane ring subunit SctC [Endozoicomonadaceae bacterium]